jgi:uncharacterized protein (DUF305 family)
MHRLPGTRLSFHAVATGAALAFSLAAFAQHVHRNGISQGNQPAAAAAGGDKAFARLMRESMNTMNAEMSGAPMSGDPDHDFASMMIPHHQGAVDMAKAELLYGKNPALRRLAQEIIVTQGSEIAVMQSELNTSSPVPSSSHSPSR